MRSHRLPRIFSHPRSGTNFLGATIKENIYPDVDLSNTGGQCGHWENRTKIGAVPFGKLFGSHVFPGRILRSNRWCEIPCIYIFRDGRAVVLSVWRSAGFLNPQMKHMRFSRYLRTKIDWNGSPGSRVITPKENIIQHWFRHVKAWHRFENRHDLLIVRYEHLLLNLDEQLNRIREFLGLSKRYATKQVKQLVGPSPHADPKIGTWKQFFKEKDLKYFHSIVPPNCPFLWGE